MILAREGIYLDVIASSEDHIQVEVQPEVASKDTLKIYVHVNGQTIFRMCKAQFQKTHVKIEHDLDGVLDAPDA